MPVQNAGDWSNTMNEVKQEPKENDVNEVNKANEPKNIVKPSETKKDVKSKETITSKNRKLGKRTSEAQVE
jgi:hypothetical protein